MNKVKVKILLEVDIVRGLNQIACTLQDIVEYELESGLNVCKVIDMDCESLSLTSFYEDGEGYLKGESYENEEDYIKRIG